MTNLKILKFWIPVVLWALVIFTFSSQESTRASQIHWQDFIIKKSAHMFVFGVLCGLLYRAFTNTSTSIRHKTAGYLSLALASFYGVTDEFHQMFTPGREPTLRDVGFDTLGAIIAILVIRYALPKAPKAIQKWARVLEIKYE